MLASRRCALAALLAAGWLSGCGDDDASYAADAGPDVGPQADGGAQVPEPEDGGVPGPEDGGAPDSGGSTPDDAGGGETPPEPVYAQFDLIHPIPLLQLLPLPTALVQDATGKVDPALFALQPCEEPSARQCLRHSKDAWPTTTPITVPFSDELDPDTVAGGVLLYDRAEGSPRKSYMLRLGSEAVQLVPGETEGGHG